jgi:spoIIIJ-associated protein
VSKPQERVREFVERIVDGLGLEGDVQVSEDDDAIKAVVAGDDLGLFIGRHGQTIDAVQHLAYHVAFRDEDRKRVVVDASGYRARREEMLERQADDAADDAVRYKRPGALDAMSAHERKHVHEYLRERGDVETYSEGQEPDRHLVVAPLED